MRVNNLLAIAVLGLTAAFAFGQASQAASQTRKAMGFPGRWATDAARAFTNGGTRPTTANGAILVEIRVDASDSRRASGLVTEFVNSLCGDPDAKLPFNNGVIDGRTLTFSVIRPSAAACPPQAGGSGTPVNWTAILSDDEQSLTGIRTLAGAGRGAGGRGGGAAGPGRGPGVPVGGAGAPGAFGAGDDRARGAFGPVTVGPPAVLTPAVPLLTPAVPALTPAAPLLTPAVPALTPTVPNAGAAGRGDRGGGGTLVLRRIP